MLYFVLVGGARLPSRGRTLLPAAYFAVRRPLALLLLLCFPSAWLSVQAVVLPSSGGLCVKKV